jgi:hypothetical protein
MVRYVYHPRILDELARHGLIPLPGTSPEQLRDAVRDLYKYEIKRLRDRLLAGGIERRHYAAAVVELRQRYPLLSLPTGLWTAARDGEDAGDRRT